MAADWTVTGQRQTTVNKPGVGLTDVMQITFTTTSGHSGTINVDLATYADANKVKGLIQDRVNQINAINAL